MILLFLQKEKKVFLMRLALDISNTNPMNITYKHNNRALCSGREVSLLTDGLSGLLCVRRPLPVHVQVA